MFDFPSSCIARFESNPHWTTQVRNPRVPTRMEHWRKPLLNTGCSVRILIMAHHFSHTTWVKQIKKHPLKTQTTKVLFHFSIGFKEVSYLSSASVKTPGKKLPHRSLTGQDEINEMKEKVLRPSFYFHPPTNISLWLVNLPLNVTTLPEIAGLIKCLWRGPLHFGHISVTSRYVSQGVGVFHDSRDDIQETYILRWTHGVSGVQSYRTSGGPGCRPGMSRQDVVRSQ